MHQCKVPRAHSLVCHCSLWATLWVKMRRPCQKKLICLNGEAKKIGPGCISFWTFAVEGVLRMPRPWVVLIAASQGGSRAGSSNQGSAQRVSDAVGYTACLAGTHAAQSWSGRCSAAPCELLVLYHQSTSMRLARASGVPCNLIMRGRG